MLQRRNNRRIIIRGNYGQHRGMVFGTGTNHRRAANVDLLDGFGFAHPWLGNRRRKGIEIDGHDINWGDLVFLQGLHMAVQITACQNRTVNGRMQGFDPAIEDFGEASQFAHAVHGNTSSSNRCFGITSGINFDTECD